MLKHGFPVWNVRKHKLVSQMFRLNLQCIQEKHITFILRFFNVFRKTVVKFLTSLTAPPLPAGSPPTHWVPRPSTECPAHPR